jgi:hypothetical protein
MNTIAAGELIKMIGIGIPKRPKSFPVLDCHGALTIQRRTMLMLAAK